jgi:hypothetical protein
VEKLVYLLRTNGDGDALREALLGESVPALRGEGARRLTVCVSDGAVTREGAPRIAQLDPKIAAEVCFWLENSDDRAGCEAILGAKAEAIEGYLALESVPIVSEERLRCDGKRSRGFTLVTAITKLPSIDYETFLRIWHEDHKLVARETQRSFSYVRNTLVRSLTDGAPGFAGIVEEGFPIEALGDQRVWYDSPDDEAIFEANRARMMESCQRFLDLGAIDSHPMSEYLLPD